MKRRATGLGALELAIGSLVLIVVIMICLDLGMVMLCNGTLDRAARDAGRAAAQQETAAEARQAAAAALISHRTDGYWISQPQLTSPNAPDFVYNDFNGNPLAGNPTVTVTTGCTVRLPIPIDFMGQKLAPVGNGGPGTIDFRRQYSFPIVRFRLAPQFR